MYNSCIEYAGLICFLRFSSISVPMSTKIDEKLTPEVAFLRLQERHHA